MTVFFLIAALLLLAGAGSLLWPLLRRGSGAPRQRTGAIVALFRDQLRELDAERRGGTVDEAQYEQVRREIERNLLAAVADADAQGDGPKRARWTALGVGTLAVILPIVLYIDIGTPDGMIAAGEGAPAQAANAAGGAGKMGARPLTGAQVQKMIEGLNEALKKNPGDAPGWAMLARAYAYQHQYNDAVRAYTRAVAITPKDARLLADTADALAMTNGQRLDGEPMRLIDRALQIDPKEVKALALAGTFAFDHQQYAKAADFWQRAVDASPNDAEFASNLRNSIDEARQLAGGGPARSATSPPDAAPGGGAPPILAAANAQSASSLPPPATSASGASVRGKVILAPNLAGKASPGDTVFVFARAAQGPRIPLAMVRRQVKDLPFEFSLDDTMAMMPDYTISKYAPVIVGARISKSGDAIAAPGDMQGFSKPAPIGANSVAVTISEVVR
jgi:cytochrome c-type biogenesis protein CcmH